MPLLIGCWDREKEDILMPVRPMRLSTASSNSVVSDDETEAASDVQSLSDLEEEDEDAEVSE